MKRAFLLAVALASGCSKSNSGPAMIAVDQSKLLFGQETGSATLLGTAPINTLQISNTGGADLVISSVTVGSGGTDPCGIDPGMFSPCGPDSGLALDSPQVFTTSAPSATTIAAGKTALVQVIFDPTAIGQYGAVLTIASNASNTPNLTVELDGDCVAPILGTPGWDGGVIDLGQVALVALPPSDGGEPFLGGFWPDGGVPTATFTVSNLGAAALQFAVAYPDGGSAACATTQCAALSSDAGDPSVIIPTWNVFGPNPVSLPPPRPGVDGGPQTTYTGVITVTFGPYFPGDYTQHVNVATNAANIPLLSFTVHALATPDGGGP
jgi:hypothetical protein